MRNNYFIKYLFCFIVISLPITLSAQIKGTNQNINKTSVIPKADKIISLSENSILNLRNQDSIVKIMVFHSVSERT